MKTTQPPQAPDATALVIERLKEELLLATKSRDKRDADRETETMRILQDAITHLAAHAELQARCARLEEDGKRLRDALNFIVFECDWEEGTHTGDNRIGTACHEALAARNAKEAT